MFVRWCDSLTMPRGPLPTTDGTVAMYLQSVANNAKTFAPSKAASAAIAFYQKITTSLYAVPGGQYRAGGGDEAVRAQPQEP